jgi:Tfp pilus assembly protein PilO
MRGLRNVLFYGIGLGLTVWVYLFRCQPQEQAAMALSGKAREMEQQLEKAKLKMSAMEILERRLSQKREEVTYLDERLSKDQDVFTVLGLISEQASRHMDVSVARIRPKGEEVLPEHPEVKRVTIEMEMSCRYTELAESLRGILELPLVHRLRVLSVETSSEQPAAVQAKMEIDFWVRS